MKENFNKSNHKSIKLQDIASHAKEYGFVFPSSDIYDGLQSVYDYGPYGIALKRNIQKLWWDSMIKIHPNIVGLDSAILMNPKTWVASGHIDGFNDLMVDNKDSKKRYRIDALIEFFAEKLIANDQKQRGKDIIVNMNSLLKKYDLAGLKLLLEKENITCETSKTCNWTEVRAFNLMLKTKLGSTDNNSEILYLRPETAQGIFVNFLNVQKSAKMKVPFGVAQIGKAFRNEIVARQFIFRMREFEQMEMQYFVTPGSEDRWFEFWKKSRMLWYNLLGIPSRKLQFHNHEQLAHYASAAVDIEYEFPFGFREIEGIHSRTDFDLSSHEELSKKKMHYFDPALNKNYIPYVVETSAGCDRVFLMVLCNAFKKIEDENGKKRTILGFSPTISPIKIAVLPLLKKDGLPEKARNIYKALYLDFDTVYEENQSIGKRYTKQDLIGTPYCICVDHTTLENDSVTVRFRDSTKQKRMSVEEARKLVAEETSSKNILSKLSAD